MGVSRSFSPNSIIFSQISEKMLSNFENNPENAIVSIIFSFLTLEAFINESSEVVNYLKDGDRITLLYYEKMEKLIKAKASTEDKYDEAINFFTKSKDHKGRQPFQDFHLLIEIRNFLVHTKADYFTANQELEKHPELRSLEDHYNNNFIKQLYNKGVLKPNDFNCNTIDLLMNFEVANWSLQVSKRMIEYFIEQTPNQELANKFRWLAYG